MYFQNLLFHLWSGTVQSCSYGANMNLVSVEIHSTLLNSVTQAQRSSWLCTILFHDSLHSDCLCDWLSHLCLIICALLVVPSMCTAMWDICFCWPFQLGLSSSGHVASDPWPLSLFSDLQVPENIRAYHFTLFHGLSFQ